MPTYDGTPQTITRNAAAALLDHTFVSINNSDQAAQTGAGAEADGVTLYEVTAVGDPVSIMIPPGFVLVRAGAAVAAGAEVMSNASGKAITVTATNKALGKAYTAASAADELIRVKLYAIPQRTA